MNDERKQGFIDDAVEREQADYPHGEIDVIEAVVTDLDFDVIVYLLYSLRTPAWDSGSGIHFPEDTRIVYSVRPVGKGGGSSGYVSQ